jgi:glycerophosphoryl diester phosphodiesterase
VPFPSDGYTDVIAHRGLHDNANGPYENSLEAFQLAVQHGADRLEMDVHRTKDGVLVIHHDPEIDGVHIASTNYADLPLLPGGYRIPTLDSVVELAHQTGAQLDVEIKVKGYEQQIVDTLVRRLPTSQFHIISFEKKAIERVERYRPDVVTGVLSPRIPAWLRESFAWPVIEKLVNPLHWPIQKAQKIGADYVSIDYRSVSDGMLNSAKAAGLGVNVWTVDDTALMTRYLRDPRIDGIVTDRPVLAMQLRDQTTGAALLS